MRILEARFHPRSKSTPSYVVVGRVVCHGARASLELETVRSHSLEPFDWEGLLKKLECLIEAAHPDPAKGLLGLKSEFWSFAEVGA